jgi:hypothetical protein
MKNQFLFRFARSPVSMATHVDRRRLAQMFRAYRAKRSAFHISRTADGYSVTCGWAKAIISRI